MIISWNVRGINNVGKCHEVISRLKKMNPAMAILIETRVKPNNAKKVLNKFGKKWKLIDNYVNHNNDRIWILWNETRIKVINHGSSSQFTHYSIHYLNGDLKIWCTTIYALNKLEQRKKLWEDIKHIHNNIKDPWFLMGDFNNVFRDQDRIRGNVVHTNEYKDLTSMMEQASLFEKYTTGDHFTWTNNQRNGIIYFRIYGVLGNISWQQQNMDIILSILNHRASDQPCPRRINRTPFKFQNIMVTKMYYNDYVLQSWNESLVGNPMYVIWKKLQRLQLVIRGMCKTFNGINQYFGVARVDLALAQSNLLMDKINFQLIDKVKECTKEVLRLSNIEERVLKQKSKVDWLRLGDGNNAYFFSSLKSKRSQTQFISLKDEEGKTLYHQVEFEQEITRYYKNLIRTAQSNLTSIYIVALITPITESEKIYSLKGIKDIYAPDIDGYSAKFFKSSWEIIK